jgi:transcriptional regulator with XRE-family HTH domain
MKTFAELLKTSRIRAGTTQTELCKKVNEALRLSAADGPLTQATLSAWESGRQMPSPTKRSQLVEIARQIKIELDTLDAVLGGHLDPKIDLPDDAYAADVRQWVSNARGEDGDQADAPQIWFLSPQYLPAFSDRSDGIKTLWKENLEAGVHYHLLWLREEIRAANVFEKLDQFLTHLADTKPNREKGGVVNVYFVRQSGAKLTTGQQLCDRAFVSKAKAANSSSGAEDALVQWRDLGTLSATEQLDAEIKDALQRWTGPLQSRLAVYVPSAKSIEAPQACLLLTDTRATMRGPLERSYRWLSEKDAEELHGLVLDLELWLKDREPSESKS